MKGPRIVMLEMARSKLLMAEDRLYDAGLEEMAFEIGLKADQVWEYIQEALDDGGMSE